MQGMCGQGIILPTHAVQHCLHCTFPCLTVALNPCSPSAQGAFSCCSLQPTAPTRNTHHTQVIVMGIPSVARAVISRDKDKATGQEKIMLLVEGTDMQRVMATAGGCVRVVWLSQAACSFEATSCTTGSCVTVLTVAMTLELGAITLMISVLCCLVRLVAHRPLRPLIQTFTYLVLRLAHPS